MGRSYTPKYVIKIVPILGSMVPPIEWKVRGVGRPTTANINRWVTKFEDSTKPGGCNAHLGFYPIRLAFIKNQFTGEVVAEWVRSRDRETEPLFEVIGGST